MYINVDLSVCVSKSLRESWSWQVEQEAEPFLTTFINQVESDGAHLAFGQLQAALKKGAEDALIAQAFRVEIFLCKGLRQHGIAQDNNDRDEIALSLSQVPCRAM